MRKLSRLLRITGSCYLFLLPLNLLAQDCSCISQFSYITDYFEKNNPAYQKIKEDAKQLAVYEAELDNLSKSVATGANAANCIEYLDAYVALLKDHHSSIGFNLQRADLSTPEAIAVFKQSSTYRSFPIINIDTSAIFQALEKSPADSIEGIYSDGGRIVFGVIKDSLPNRYLGIVLRQNKLLEPGQVLMKIEHSHDKVCKIYYNVGLLGFSPAVAFKSAEIENGNMPYFGFAKTFTGASTKGIFELRKLDDSTNYLRLSDFAYEYQPLLDSFYKAVDADLAKLPYLIIDVRGNGGGSETNYTQLLKYAYTRPLNIDSVTVWVTPENIGHYESYHDNTHEDLIRRMKAARPFTFIPYSLDTQKKWEMDNASLLPKKIALLFDRGTASAAEGLILYLMQSDKVITIGENSGGYLGYGNVMTTQTPCGVYTILSTTTRYFEKSKYEFVGIPPTYQLSKKEDWIQFAQDKLSSGGTR